MLWLMVLPGLLFAAGFTALAAGSAELPRHIQTFRRSSAAERAFDQRAGRFRALGFAGLCLAAVIAVVVVVY